LLWIPSLKKVSTWMRATPRLLLYRLAPSLSLLLLLNACQDSGPISPDGMDPLLHISHGGTKWGNPQFQFRPPLGPNLDPTAAPNEVLKPYVRICVTDEDDGGSSEGKTWPDVGWDGCVEDVTLAATGFAEGLVMEHTGEGEYKADWDTSPLLDLRDHEGNLQSFRIEVWGLAVAAADGKNGPERLDLVGDPRWLFGWRDITQSPSVASCNQDPEQEICRVNYGQNIPVKVWIGQSVFCPDTGDCAVQFVDPNLTANLTAGLGGGLFGHLVIPSGAAEGGFALAFEPCSESESKNERGIVEGTIDLPTFDPCLKTVTPPDLPLLAEDKPAIISVCTPPGTPDGLQPGQQVQLALHHFSTRGSSDGSIVSVEAWPHAENCVEDPTSGPAIAFASEPEGASLSRFARALGSRVLAWTNLQPRPLVARAPAPRWDVGVGGSGRDINSFWMFALPGAFDGKDRQTVAPDADGKGEIKVLVLDLDGVAVENADVTFFETDENFQKNEDLENLGNLGTVTTGSDGVASILVDVKVGEEHYFVAEGNGIAGPDPDPDTWICPLVGTLGTEGGKVGACNGPRDGVADPFQPLSTGHHFDDDEDGPPVTLTRGAFPITAVACQTPDPDGILSEGEWDCAQEAIIQVNLSGGSKVDGRLLWMNDDENFYLAVEVPGADRTNNLRIEWHRNENEEGPPNGLEEGDTFTASRALGADVWEFHPGDSPPARDMFIDDQCSGSTQSSCGQNDADFGGEMRTSGAFRNDVGGVTVYEISHPLTSPDRCAFQRQGSRGCRDDNVSIDLNAGSGDLRAFFLSLRMGSGAQGQTVWPGFLKYLVVEIK
jgi:hypothetical protein